MAFSFTCNLDVEYRGNRTGTSSKTGDPWMSLLFEDEEQSQLSVSVPKDMLNTVYELHLRKGDQCHIRMLASARADGNSYLMLRDIDVELEDDGADY